MRFYTYFFYELESSKKIVKEEFTDTKIRGLTRFTY